MKEDKKKKAGRFRLKELSDFIQSFGKINWNAIKIESLDQRLEQLSKRIDQVLDLLRQIPNRVTQSLESVDLGKINLGSFDWGEIDWAQMGLNLFS